MGWLAWQRNVDFHPVERKGENRSQEVVDEYQYRQRAELEIDVTQSG
jgi:hypothetical protein